MLGSPVAHSLSPVLHNAAYAALGLTSWSYEAVECDDRALPGFVRGLGAEWAGLSVTMPGKHAALAAADQVTETAAAVGAANTLVPVAGGWLADCTDVDGVIGALRGVGLPSATSAAVLGAGGTACAAAVGLSRMGVRQLTVVARSAARAADVLSCAARVGLAAQLLPWSSVADLRAEVLVSTVPAGVADPHAELLARCRVVLDVVYHPWPTALATAVSAAGGRLATGLDMLLHQAFGQVQLFTGQPAPQLAMREALHRAVGRSSR